MTFAEQLNYIMETEGLTRKEVSTRTGFTEVSIGRYLSGDRRPNVGDAQHIIETLGYDFVVCKKENEKNKKCTLFKNASGYTDITAGKAIKKADADRDRMLKLLDVIFTICDYADFHVEGRIMLKDRKTGKIWR